MPRRLRNVLDMPAPPPPADVVEVVQTLCLQIGRIGCLFPVCTCGHARLICAAYAAGVKHGQTEARLSTAMRADGYDTQ